MTERKMRKEAIKEMVCTIARVENWSLVETCDLYLEAFNETNDCSEERTILESIMECCEIDYSDVTIIVEAISELRSENDS